MHLYFRKDAFTHRQETLVCLFCLAVASFLSLGKAATALNEWHGQIGHTEGVRVVSNRVSEALR